MIARQSGPEKGTMVRQVADGRLSAANVIQGNERRIKRLMELFCIRIDDLCGGDTEYIVVVRAILHESCGEQRTATGQSEETARIGQRSQATMHGRPRPTALYNDIVFGASGIVIPGVSLYSGFVCKMHQKSIM